MKKLVSLVIVMALVMSLAVGAAAAGNGSITITNSVVGQKYTIYKVFDLTYGEDGSVAYTKTITVPVGPDNQYQILNASDISPFDVTNTNTNQVYNITLKEGKTEADVISFLTTYTAARGILIDTVTATSTSTVITGLDYGYYYIESTVGSVVTIDSAMPNAEVEDKNTAPSVVKTVDDATANIGDDVTFTIKITVGSGAQNYVLHDSMDEGFDTPTDFTVTSTVNGQTDTLTNSQYTVVTENICENCNFHITTNETLVQGSEITIAYKTKLNDNAVIAGTGNNNTAYVSYGGDTTNPLTTPSATATVHTYALALQKVDQDSKPLANATFALPFYVKTTADTDDNAYIYAGSTDGEDLTNSLTTPDNGLIIIKGLKDGNYSFTETQSPAGYNNVQGAISVPVTASTSTSTSQTFYLDKNGNEVDTEATDGSKINVNIDNISADVTLVVNKAGSVLPSTGGMGTTIFYVLGGLMFVGALVLLVTNKRMKAE